MPADTRTAAASNAAEPPATSEPRFCSTEEGRVAWVEAGPQVEEAGGVESGLESEAQSRVGVGAGSLPLILIHGFTGHRDDFLPVLEPLARSRRVIIPDLRGHGDSDAGPGLLGWSFEQLVKDLSCFLDALGVARCDLLGHSMGGFVTQRFVLAQPERVRSLTLLCTGPEPPASLSPEGFEKAVAIAESRGMDGLQAVLERVGRRAPSPTIAGWLDRYWAHHRRRLGAMTPASYSGLGRAFFGAESLVARLPEIAQRTLVLVGEFDADWLPGAERFEQNLPRARRIILRRAEHHPHQENPQDFLAALEEHLGVADPVDEEPVRDAANRGGSTERNKREGSTS